MKYVYDSNGNLTSKVDPRNVTASYGYDALNRNIWTSYNDGITPTLERHYDAASNGKGRLYYTVNYNLHPLTSAAAYSYTQINGYDAMGRVTGQTQNFLNTGGTWTGYTTSRNYDLAGHPLAQTYPSNRTVTNAYGDSGRLTGNIGTLGDGSSRNYATGMTYTAAGLMSRETFGMQAATLYHNLHYNNRQQLVDIRVGDSSTDEWNWTRGALVFYYGTTARDSWNAFANSTDNNGNVLRQINYVPLSGGGNVIPQLDDYNYDALNRITSVSESQQNSGGTWTFNLFTQNFGYDRWGNRTVSCSPCQSGVTGDTFTVDTATNRLTAKNGVGMTYDSAGNQTYDATGNRWFDGENRMHKATQGSVTSHYVYDADGKRVRRIVGSTETWMVYGLDGELVAEYAANGASGSPQKEYGYRGGQMLIVAQASPLEIRWTVPDHLGTPRMNIRGTGTDGGSLASVTRHDYLPFGEELVAGVGLRSSSSHGYEPPSDGVRQKFAQYERDSETSLDFVQARYYSSLQGRFISVDPLNPIIDYTSDRAFFRYIAQPQNWNGYAFNRNNPLKYVDRDGKHPALIGALIGGAFGAGIELAKQIYTLQPGQEVDWGKVAGASVRGAIVGGVAGATGGLSLLQYAGASAAANVVGGIAGRATEVVTNNAVLDWKPDAFENIDDYALDMDSIIVDGIAGAAGGLAGKFAESQAIRLVGQKYLNTAAYNRAVQTLRNIDGKSDKQVNNAAQVLQSGFNNFFSLANQARNYTRAAATAGITATAKKHKSVDCDKPGSGCKTEVRVIE